MSQINFGPADGTEIEKTRLAIITGSDAVGPSTMKLVAPVAARNVAFGGKARLVEVGPAAFRGHNP